MSGSQTRSRHSHLFTRPARSGCAARAMRPSRPTSSFERAAMKAQSILETIGDTPHVRVNRLFDARIEVWFKQERANPGGSIKDRIALAMVEDAEERGILHDGSVVVEPTSGNTGIGLAFVCAVKGYRLI